MGAVRSLDGMNEKCLCVSVNMISDSEAGDLILYQGSSFVIYYDTNLWNFTRLSKIKDVSADELREILGNGDVTVTLSLEK